jgi:predicted CopG family antitoxin
MCTKNIALNSKVYEKLAKFKGESESFSKAIERLLDRIESINTGANILKQLSTFRPIDDREAKAMQTVVDHNRNAEDWDQCDLS